MERGARAALHVVPPSGTGSRAAVPGRDSTLPRRLSLRSDIEPGRARPGDSRAGPPRRAHARRHHERGAGVRAPAPRDRGSVPVPGPRDLRHGRAGGRRVRMPARPAARLA